MRNHINETCETNIMFSLHMIFLKVYDFQREIVKFLPISMKKNYHTIHRSFVVSM